MLKWGRHFQELGPYVLKNVWIVCASLHNSYDLLLGHLPAWLLSHIAFTASSQCPPPEQMYELWTIFGVEPDIADVLVRQLRLHWDHTNGLLRIDESWQGHPDTMEHVSGALLGVCVAL